MEAWTGRRKNALQRLRPPLCENGAQKAARPKIAPAIELASSGWSTATDIREWNPFLARVEQHQFFSRRERAGPYGSCGRGLFRGQKASDGDQPDYPPLPTPARRNSPDCAMDTPEEHSSGESSIEIESLSVLGASEDELIWAPDPDDGISQFIDAAAHRLLEQYRIPKGTYLSAPE